MIPSKIVVLDPERVHRWACSYQWRNEAASEPWESDWLRIEILMI